MNKKLIDTNKPKTLAFKHLSSQIELIPLGKMVSSRASILTQPHRVDFYQIFVFSKSTPKHRVDFLPVQVVPFSLLFINKGRVHQFDPSLMYEGTLVVFTDDFFSVTESDQQFLAKCLVFNDINDRFLLSINDRFLLSINEGTYIRIQSILKNIQTESDVFEKEVTPAIQKNLLHNLLLIAEHEKRKIDLPTKGRNLDLDLCLQFKSLLNEHFRKKRSVSFYASSISIPERRLSQVTLSLLGKSPKEVIDARILLEAKRLLVHGNASVKEIGYHLGFEDPTYFVKFFKKQNQCTPLEFRELNTVKR